MQRLRTLKSEDGFTLIELLVVVVIIGILIAIAIPLYLNYENGARNKSSASDLRAAISTIEQCKDDNGTLPATFSTSAASFSPCANETINLSSDSTIAYYPSGEDYMLVGYQGTGATWYCFNSSVAGPVITETGTLATSYATC